MTSSSSSRTTTASDTPFRISRLVVFACLLTGVGCANETASNGSTTPPLPARPLNVITVEKEPIVAGLRLEPLHDGHGESALGGYTTRGVSIVAADAPVQVVLFGFWLDELQEVAFTTSNCSHAEMVFDQTEFVIQTDKRVVVYAEFAKTLPDHHYRLCTKHKPKAMETDPYFEEVAEPRTRVSTDTPPRQYYLPLHIQIAVITVLLVLSGLFSGLNLGLMALTPQELMLIQKSGSKTEQKYASAILPVRAKGNLLLCSLLIGNVCVNSGISILLDDLTSGYVALIASSAGIVVFGEIFPQSLCVKKGLAVGAQTLFITRFFMVITWPIAYPISKLLDCILGDEVVAYDRKRLMELIKMSTRDETGLAEELKIAVGAMEISDKTVSDVMTKIDDVFMLPDTTVLNTKTVAEILRMGYTRIPVYKGDRNCVVSLLFVKDLALLDPDDCFTIQTVCGYHRHQLRFIMEDTPLRVMLEEFKRGDYHLAMVQRIVAREDQDPGYELVGVVTLEDIVEEILQAEIVDETDAVTDNVHRIRRRGGQAHELACLLDGGDEASRVISVQMQLVTMQWLTTNHPAFQPQILSPGVLEKLIRQHVRKVELSHIPDMYDKKAVIPRTAKLYTKQEFSDKFILILEGRALVTIGQDAMTFEAGPWHAFGGELLETLKRELESEGGEKSHSRGSMPGARTDGGDRDKDIKAGFVPDFSVVIRDQCTFLEISAHTYRLAYRTTLIGRGTARVSIGDEHRGSRVSLDEKAMLLRSPMQAPQNEAIARVKRNGKPRSASESEQVELLPRDQLNMSLSPEKLSPNSSIFDEQIVTVDR